MTKANNRSILIVGDDDTIRDAVGDTFRSHNVHNFLKDRKIPNSLDLIILDECKIDKDAMEKLLSLKNVINISKNRYEKIVNLERPFSLNNFLRMIKQTLLNGEKTLEFGSFEIVGDTLKYKGKEVIFGHREISLIRYLYRHKSAPKETLLREVWGYGDDIETKVLENTINKIRQKFKSVGISDFIVYGDGQYKLAGQR